MKIKIVCCPVSTYWYNDKVGEEYQVIRAVTYPFNEGKGFQVNYDDGNGYVNLDDAEIVFEEF